LLLLSSVLKFSDSYKIRAMNINQNQEKIGLSLGRIASGLYIVTFFNQEISQQDGVLISWLQQCSFDPPMLSLCLKKDRKSFELIKLGKIFTVNVLGKSNLKILGNFYKEAGEEKFKGLETGLTNQKIKFIKESVCFLECEIVETFSAKEQDHSLIVAKVISADLLNTDKNEPALHLRKNGFNY